MAVVSAVGFGNVSGNNVAATASASKVSPKDGNQFDQLLNGKTVSQKSDTVSQSSQDTKAGLSGSKENSPLRKDLVSKSNSSENSVSLNETGTKEEIIGNITQEMRSIVKEQLGLSDEELDGLLDAMGILVTDLLNMPTLQQFVLTANGSEEPMDLLVNEDLLGQITDLMESFQTMGDENLQKLIQNMEVLDTPITLEEFLQQSGEELVDVQITTSQQEPVLDKQEQVVTSSLTENVKVQEQDLTTVKDNTVAQEEKNGFQGQITVTTDNTESSSQNSGQEMTDAEENVALLFTEQEPAQESETVLENGFADQFLAVQNTAAKVTDAGVLGSQRMQQMVDIVNQVSEQIKSSVSDTTTTMEMQLNPERLGKVYFSVVSKEGVMTATFRVESDEAKHALESQIMTLKENLEAKNLKVESVEVQVSDFDFSQSSEAEKQNQDQAVKQMKKRFQFDDGEETSEEIPVEEQTVRESDMGHKGSNVDYTA